MAVLIKKALKAITILDKSLQFLQILGLCHIFAVQLFKFYSTAFGVQMGGRVVGKSLSQKVIS